MGVIESWTQFEQHVHMHKLLEQIIFSSLIKPESDFRKLDYLRDVGRIFLIILHFFNVFVFYWMKDYLNSMLLYNFQKFYTHDFV